MKNADCEKIREKMTVAIEGDERLIGEIDAHVRQCAVCRLAWNELLDVDRNLSGYAQETVAAEDATIDTNALFNRIETTKKRRTKKRTGVALLAALVIVIAAVVALRRETPPLPVTHVATRKVAAFYDLAYGPATARHKIDVYAPENARRSPVLVFLHGGFWTTGDKRQKSGLYENLGRALAARGIVAAIPNFHHDPADARAAVTWTTGQVAEFGGDPERIFLGGYNSGATTALLLGADETFTSGIAGLVAIGGFYTFDPHGKQMERVLRKAFGKDPALLQSEAPIAKLDRGVPGALFIAAADELQEVELDFFAMMATSKDLARRDIFARTATGDHVGIVREAEEHGLPEIIAEFVAKKTAPNP